MKSHLEILLTFKNRLSHCCLAPVAFAGILLTSGVSGAVDSTHAQALFKHPSREYSTGPLWVWNDMLTEGQIRETLRDLAAQDVKQVWVHPRPGLMTPYLSPEWFRLWKVALDEAGRLDMNVWIYDENSYPSGFAGGWVPELMPESRGRGLEFKETTDAPNWSEDFLGVWQLGEAGVKNVTRRVQSGDSLTAGRYLAAMEVRAQNSPWHGDRCYVNLLSPGVTEKFLEVTMDAYRREVGSQFGKRVPGVFSDEPNLRPAGSMAWSETLAAEFRKRWGYDLVEHLPSLARPVGDWRRVRHNYYQVLNEQFIEHWSKPYHRYCETNHLEWTGHYWDHEWPNCGMVPDNMAMYAWHQRPAIDCLMNQYAENTHAQFGNVRMVRELSSIANQLGMSRTLCEVYGAGGWDLRFEDMKRIGDWLEVLGVNTLDQHLSYVTIRGARKRDHPQSFSYHEPWWDCYHVSAQYLARLSAAMSQGRQVNPILVIEPTTTAWMYQGDDARLEEIGRSFFNLVMALEAAQVEYDLASEDVLARHGAANGALGLTVGDRSYGTVVMPDLNENLNARTLELLRSFENAGGRLLSLGPPPQRIDGSLSSAGARLAVLGGWKRIDTSALALEAALPDFHLDRASGDEGILFHHRRRLSDGELLLLVNTSITSPSKGSLWSARKGVVKWDLYSGNTQAYPFAAETNGVQAAFELPPSGSLLLFLSASARPARAASGGEVTVLRPEGTAEVRRLEPNVLTLDYVDITAGDETKTHLYFYQANQFAWQKNGRDRNPWDSAVQFRDEIISKAFPADSGFTASYHFTVGAVLPKSLTFVMERPDLYEITYNGRRVAAKPGEWWLDKAFGRIDLGDAGRVGDNVITIKAAPFTIYHELEPAYLLGDFALKPAERGFEVVTGQRLTLSGASESVTQRPATGELGWNEQGCPFYSAGVAYSEKFALDRVSGAYTVALSRWRGSVAKVLVNGHTAGCIDAPPWECNVTRWLKRGENQVEVTVIGTLKNTLGPHHGNPALGSAWPGSFQHAPKEGPPPGAQYSTVAYGLFEPFVLKRVAGD